MKKKDLIDFGGNTWKDRKDSQEYGGREVQVLDSLSLALVAVLDSL